MFITFLLVTGCFLVPERSEGRDAGECSDAADNDGDGLFDCDDDDCFGSPDCDATTPTVPDTGEPMDTGDGTAPPEISIDFDVAVENFFGATTLPNDLCVQLLDADDVAIGVQTAIRALEPVVDGRVRFMDVDTVPDLGFVFQVQQCDRSPTYIPSLTYRSTEGIPVQGAVEAVAMAYEPGLFFKVEFPSLQQALNAKAVGFLIGRVIDSQGNAVSQSVAACSECGRVVYAEPTGVFTIKAATTSPVTGTFATEWFTGEIAVTTPSGPLPPQRVLGLADQITFLEVVEVVEAP